MKDILLHTIHLISLVVRLLQPGELKSVATEYRILKRQLLVIRRSGVKASNLKTLDRFIFGWLAMILSPNSLPNNKPQACYPWAPSI